MLVRSFCLFLVRERYANLSEYIVICYVTISLYLILGERENDDETKIFLFSIHYYQKIFKEA